MSQVWEERLTKRTDFDHGERNIIVDLGRSEVLRAMRSRESKEEHAMRVWKVARLHSSFFHPITSLLNTDTMVSTSNQSWQEIGSLFCMVFIEMSTLRGYKIIWETFGELDDVIVRRDHATGRSHGFGYGIFSSVEDVMVVFVRPWVVCLLSLYSKCFLYDSHSIL